MSQREPFSSSKICRRCQHVTQCVAIVCVCVWRLVASVIVRIARMHIGVCVCVWWWWWLWKIQFSCPNQIKFLSLSRYVSASFAWHQNATFLMATLCSCDNVSTTNSDYTNNMLLLFWADFISIFRLQPDQWPSREPERVCVCEY